RIGYTQYVGTGHGRHPQQLSVGHVEHVDSDDVTSSAVTQLSAHRKRRIHTPRDVRSLLSGDRRAGCIARASEHIMYARWRNDVDRTRMRKISGDHLLETVFKP